VTSSRNSPAESPHPSRAEVQRQLERILANPLFQTSQRFSRFLRFAVESVLGGLADQLKESVIGVEVFGLSESYSPQENPIVRITAGRLRSRLAEYYLSCGMPDPVFIEIPKGSYVPRFAVQRHLADLESVQVAQDRISRVVCVGREQELNRLWSAFASAQAGEGAMWSWNGDAGMGKTTLGEAFLAGIPPQSPAVFIGRGSCSERLAENDAYVPILETLHTLLCDGPGQEAARVMQTTAPTWYRLVGPVASKPGARPKDGVPATYERLRREIVDFFEALSAAGPAVFFLDDLHWADASTCDLLAYIGGAAQSLSRLDSDDLPAHGDQCAR
jgi:hypothetical protein